MRSTILPSKVRFGAERAGRATLRLCAALSLVGAVTVTAAAPAWAAGETIGGCVLEKVKEAKDEHGSLEAVKALPADDLEALETDLEGCLESPNPILPALDEIIWGGLAFAVLFAFMWWKGFPAVKRAMDARSEKIRADLDAADSAKADAMRTKSEYEAQLAEAKTAAAAIIDEARGQADQLRQDLQARAEADIAEQRARAAADIDSSRRQAIDDLRTEVAAIAVGAAERVVGASLDADVHRSLIDGYIDDVAGAASNSNGDGS
ncbi:MAG: F0F1 ATP synthase subunit B [Acidimicrobiaceae bacterium]|nr:F0F1 ATP synthase subunit B [Acidimicrobiaceae bacterium]MYE75444.1 F0F1 ATP synthase subunit B [Acidimicrobiaceae bacterium]MYE96045.1 F0F1 ATP synthase subunit B [Acidimicrobiaceae bacterium]MYH42916.1 F0F1 ATP synthase subunit B [Acidimicrobiaceae bacterium]MYI55012.1 F0F1 ATP synthase subunit B [Acidimicrobiaceae bacterium]